AALGGPKELVASLAGIAVALVLIPGWLMRWMGAGDVKLMAAVGAWLAWPQAGIALLASLVAGGVISVVVAARRRGLWPASQGAPPPRLQTRPRSPTPGRPPASTGVRFPFALAVLAGCTTALWLRA